MRSRNTSNRNRIANRTQRTIAVPNSVTSPVRNQRYSFGKEDRMPAIRKAVNQSIGSDLRSSINERACGFGIG